MYIKTLQLENTRTFVKSKFDFIHPDRKFDRNGAGVNHSKKLLPRPRWRNVNLLLGDNGSGKTTILRAIAMATLGPAAVSAGLRDPGLVRRAADLPKDAKATIQADFQFHQQDRVNDGTTANSRHEIGKRGDVEQIKFLGQQESIWEPVFEEKNDAFFVVGYGATRRVERPEHFDLGARTQAKFARVQRVASLFEDSFSLIPLTYWLPELKKKNPGRYTQVIHLIDRILGPGHFRMTEELDRGDYLFERGGMKVPFRALSDGYRAFVGWVGDLLYHICFGAPSGKKLVESSGVVLVDEIDLHLHPRWQLKVIPTLAKSLPRMQFVFTSHSPLVAGSLEWMNIITLKTQHQTNSTRVRRLRQSIHGLDADQILLSDFFGMKTTMAPEKQLQLEKLTDQIREGVAGAPLKLIRLLSQGLEAVE